MRCAPNIPVYTLSGNHDMYSGGAPYYRLLTQLNATPALDAYRQQASYFCLTNGSWQILAMDTGLHDNDPATMKTNVTYLEPEEAAWHADKLRNAGGRRTVVLSHHQLFTAFGDGVGQITSGKPLAYNPKLYAVFQPFIEDIALWLWGHEHNFEVFNSYLGLNKGRCIGASAIPVLEEEDPYGPIAHPDLQDQTALPTLDPDVGELKHQRRQNVFSQLRHLDARCCRRRVGALPDRLLRDRFEQSRRKRIDVRRAYFLIVRCFE